MVEIHRNYSILNKVFRSPSFPVFLFLMCVSCSSVCDVYCGHIIKLLLSHPSYCLHLSQSPSPGSCWSLVQLSALISWSPRKHLLPGQSMCLCLWDFDIPGNQGSLPLLNFDDIITRSWLMLQWAGRFLSFFFFNSTVISVDFALTN